MKSKNMITLFIIFALLIGCQATTEKTETNSNLITNSQKQQIDFTSEVKKCVSEYLQEDTQNVGIYYSNLDTQETFTMNAETQFRSASIAKLFVVMYAYEQIHLGFTDKNALIYYNANSDYEGGTGILQYEDLSQPITIERLLNVAITHSDNIAYYMLLRFFGTPAIMEYYENIIGHKTPHDYIYMSADDTQKLLHKIYYEDCFQTMKVDMQNTVFNDRIALYLPSNIVAHKIGNFDSYVHDAAIVETNQPYLLIIFSKDLNNAYQKIAEISKLIYDLHLK